MRTIDKEFYKTVKEIFTVPVNGEFVLDEEKVKKMTLKEFESFVSAEIDEVLSEMECEYSIDFTTPSYEMSFDKSDTVEKIIQELNTKVKV